MTRDFSQYSENVTCHRELGVCTSEPISYSDIYLKVSPKGSHESLFISSVFVGEGYNVYDISLPSARGIQGTVLGQTLEGQQREIVSANLTFRRYGSPFFNVGDEVSVVTRNLPGENTADQDQDFIGYEALFNVSDAFYDTWIEPIGRFIDLYPPFRVDELSPLSIASEQEKNIGRFDFEFPSFVNLPVLIFDASDTSSNERIPWGDLQLKLKNGVDGEIISSTATTRSLSDTDGYNAVLRLEQGFFSWCWERPEGCAVALQITPALQEQPIAILTVEFALGQTEDLQIGIQMPNVKNLRGRVENTVSGMRTNLSNVLVRIRSESLDGVQAIDGVTQQQLVTTAEYSVTHLTNEDGFFEAALFPGSYMLNLVDQSDEKKGIYFERLDIPMYEPDSQLDNDNEFLSQIFDDIPSRFSQPGWVGSGDGRSSSGTTIFAQPQRQAQPPVDELNEEEFGPLGGQGGDFPYSDLARATRVTSDVAGKLDLRLDIGTFNVTTKPFLGSAFPWIVVQDLKITEEGSSVPFLNLPLLPPTVLSGQITGFSDSYFPMDEIKIEAYLDITPDDQGADAQDRRFILMGEAEVSNHGLYELLLPPYVFVNSGAVQE